MMDTLTFSQCRIGMEANLCYANQNIVGLIVEIDWTEKSLTVHAHDGAHHIVSLHPFKRDQWINEETGEKLLVIVRCLPSIDA